MIHYSCDRCGRNINPEDDLRYVVKMEIYAAMDPLCASDADDDRDHLLEIHEILERMEDTDNEAIGDDVYRQVRLDLCCDCQRKFVKDPLGREVATRLGFSQN